MKISGIYKIRSIVNPKKEYIGSSVDIYLRWRGHLRDLKNNKHGNSRLQNHYNKYGKTDLVFSILIGCDKNDLISTEQFYIDAYSPFFNICKKAGSTLGRKLSEETKRKLSEINKGENHPKYGTRHSEETRQKISIARKGYKQSEDHRRKNGEVRKGSHHTIEAKKKISEGMIGINTWSKGNKNACGKRSNEARAKMRESRLNYLELQKIESISIN